MSLLVILLIVILVILVLAGIGVGLYFLLRPEPVNEESPIEPVGPTNEPGPPPPPPPPPPPSPPVPPEETVIPAEQTCERETFRIAFNSIIDVDTFTTYSVGIGVPLKLVTIAPDATYVANNNIPGNYYFNGINRSDQLTVNYLDATFNNLVEDQTTKYPLIYTSIPSLPYVLVSNGSAVTSSFLTDVVSGVPLTYKYSFSATLPNDRLAQIVFSIPQGQLTPGTEILTERGRYQYSYYQQGQTVFVDVPEYIQNNLLVSNQRLTSDIYFYTYNTATIETIPSGQTWTFHTKPYDYYTYTYPMALDPTRVVASFVLNGVTYTTTSGNFLLFGGQGYVYFTYRLYSGGLQIYLPYYTFVAPDLVKYNNLLVQNGSNAFTFDLVTITS